MTPASRPRAILRAGPWLALLLFAVLAFVPGIASLPVTDRDEARFVQASRQMVESGDFVDIRFQDEARHKKPVGIYWLQSAAVLASGQGPGAGLWVYRLPSLIGATLAVLLVAVVGTPLFGRPAALAAAAVFAGGLVIGGEARIAKTDAALLASILAAQAVLVRLYLGRPAGRAGPLAFWLAIAAGTLIKGPIGPMVPALTALTLCLLDRRAGWLRPLRAPVPVLVALLVTLPWFLAITLRSNGTFWLGSVATDLLPKIASGQEGKGAPPGSYLIGLWFTFWPATPLLVLSLPAIWRARREAATRFCLAWIIPVWLLYEAIPTKLIHYTLPVFPALALLAAGHLPTALATASRPLRIVAAVSFLPGLALGIAILGYAAATENRAAMWLAGAGLAGAGLAATFALRSFAASRPLGLAAFLGLAGVVLHASLILAVARMPVFWPTEAAMALAAETAALNGCARPRMAGLGYTEPSLVWRGGRDTRLYSGPGTAGTDVIRPGPCLVAVSLRDGGFTPDALAQGCRLVGTVAGFAIGAGRQVTLDILDCHGEP
ncbi:MAG: glycosyltransferase family 39 protein [Rhodobacter sp.]|nr:glycosyltransferase family 39 protein [Rhodobacter sp.]